MMKKTSRAERQCYLKPAIAVFDVAGEYSLLAESPLVRPGGGGVPPHQGNIHVIDPTEEDGGDDDNLEG